jgi:hypothetical protein
VSGQSHHAVLAIVDRPGSHHGRLMEQCARAGGSIPSIRWIAPSLDLPEELDGLAEVSAVALPVGVRDAGSRDRFTRRLSDAIASLMARGIPVYVAAGTRRPNLLAGAGIAVSIADEPSSRSSSEACVRVAARAAIDSPIATPHLRRIERHGQCNS